MPKLFINTTYGFHNSHGILAITVQNTKYSCSDNIANIQKSILGKEVEIKFKFIRLKVWNKFLFVFYGVSDFLYSCYPTLPFCPWVKDTRWTPSPPLTPCSECMRGMFESACVRLCSSREDTGADISEINTSISLFLTLSTQSDTPSPSTITTIIINLRSNEGKKGVRKGKRNNGEY